MNRTGRVMDFRVVSWLRMRHQCEDDRDQALKARWDATLRRYLEERAT